MKTKQTKDKGLWALNPADRQKASAPETRKHNWHLDADAYNNAEALAEALRDCVTTPGALAERSHEYALRRLKTITETAQAALNDWEAGQ